MTDREVLPVHGDALAGGGDMGRRIREHDWAATPLGAIASWPQSLKTSLSLILNAQMPMWLGWGPECRFFYNDAYVDVLSHAKHPWALGRPAREVWREIWHVCGPLAEQVFRDAAAPFVEDVRLFMDRGDLLEEVYYSFSYSPIRDERGQVAGLFCPNTEVTAKLLHARRLRTLSELATSALGESAAASAYAAIARTLEANRDDVPFAMVYSHGAAGAPMLEQAVRVDRAAAAPERWPIDAVLDDHAARVLEVDDDRLPLGLADQRVRQVVVLPIASAESERPFGVLVAGVNPTRRLDPEHRAFFDLIAAHAATALHQATAAEQARWRAELLAELDRAKTTFFSNISHEFRTPLTLMIGPTEDALASPERALRGDGLETVYRNELRLLKLVNALLDFSRLEAGRMAAVLEPLDLATTTRDLTSGFRSAIERAGLALDVHIDDLPQPIAVDRDMWEKIVLNLLSNALKFTLEGRITVSLRPRGEVVELAVADTGIGIPPGEMPRLFERFHRIENPRARTHEGSGIGLALVHELTRLHGGAISVDSAPGRGSEFRVRIPVGSTADAVERSRPPAAGGSRTAFLEEAQRWALPATAEALATATAVPATATAVRATATGASATVLLADDNADMRDYVGRLLAAHWRVIAVADGEAAVEVARRERPDLVLSDIMMPGLDGFGVLAALRGDERTRDIPVLLLSARAGDEARVEGLEAGADDYLVKPFSARELVARVRTHLTLAAVRQRAERDRREVYELLMQVPAAISVRRGPDLRCVFQNAASLALLDQREQSLAETWPESSREWLPRYERARAGETHSVQEVFATRPWRGGVAAAATTRYWDVTYTPVRFAFEDDVGVMTIAVEVTDRVSARRSAEAASRAKDEFLAMLGHELRNPLAPITTAVQLLKLRGAAGAKEFEVIDRQVRHLSRLVDDLLDISRLTRGLIELRRERVRIDEVIAKAVEIVSPLIEQKGHFLTIDVDDRIWLDADPVRLAQVFSNLLTNAARYTPPGGRIAIVAAPAGKAVRVRVTDDGIGIDPALRERIFELFVQGRSDVARSEGGLGIGLALVRSLVQLHGGEVSVRSEGAGRGSELIVELPAQFAATAPLPPRAELVLPSTPARRVLVVDDNVDAAELLTMALRRLGHEVALAHDGASALAALATFRPEVAILDIGLPVMDGYELAGHVRGLVADCRLIALTGYGLDSDRARSRDAGFDAHLVKPVELRRLLVAIEPSEEQP